MKNPLLLALLAHLAALLLIWLSTAYLSLIPTAQLLLQGGLAALIGRLLGLPYWWLPINLLLPILLVGMLTLDLPPWIYLLGFALLLLLQWNSTGERVPLYLSNPTTWQALDALIDEYRPKRFTDLGSGLGGALFYLAPRHPECQFVGVESAPLPFAFAWLRLQLTGHRNIRLQFGSLWDYALHDGEMIYAFLSPAPMARLEEKLRQQATGSLFVSNSFPLPESQPLEIVALADRRHTQLYLYGKSSPRSRR